jgi:diguanylate cyclase (GGDEF)-like protein
MSIRGQSSGQGDDVQRSLTLGRCVHIGLPTAIITFAVLYLTLPQLAGDIVYGVAALTPVVAILVGMRVHRVEQPLHLYLLLTAMALMAVPSLAWIVQVDLLGQRTTSDGFYLVAALGYLFCMAGSVVIVARHAPTDPGGVLHAALVGLGLSGLPWAFVIRPPMLAADTAPVMQLVVVIVVMCLMTIMGSLLRVVATTRQAKASLGYLFVSQISALAATACVNLTNDQYGNHARWADILWFVGYFSISAAVLHPALNRLTTPQRAYPDDMSARSLITTGVVLSVNPAVSIASLLVGNSPDVLLMSMSALISVPILLTRFWYLGMQRLKAERALAHQAAHDELTGLPNRRALMEKVDDALRNVRDGSIDAVAVFFFDLDGFKPINDTLGHRAGDEVLRVVGQRLKRCVRGDDVVGRLGGDEFLVMCSGLNGRVATDMAERLRAELSQPILVTGNTCTVGASIGITVATRESTLSADALIAEADNAMYAVKRTRKESRSAA